MTALGLCVVSLLPLGLPRWGALAPPLMLAAVYYWSLSRPNLLPPIIAAGLGLFQDLLTNAPVGSGVLVMVLVQWILRSQQRFFINRPFLLLWAAFAPVVLGAAIIDWVVYAGYTLSAPPIVEGLVRAALAFVLFPLVAGLVLIPAHRALTTE